MIAHRNRIAVAAGRRKRADRNVAGLRSIGLLADCNALERTRSGHAQCNAAAAGSAGVDADRGCIVRRRGTPVPESGGRRRSPARIRRGTDCARTRIGRLGAAADTDRTRPRHAVATAQRNRTGAVRRVAVAERDRARTACRIAGAERDCAVAAGRLRAADCHRAAVRATTVGRRTRRTDRDVLAGCAGNGAIALCNAVCAVGRRTAADRDAGRCAGGDRRLAADRNRILCGRLCACGGVAADCGRADAGCLRLDAVDRAGAAEGGCVVGGCFRAAADGGREITGCRRTLTERRCRSRGGRGAGTECRCIRCGGDRIGRRVRANGDRAGGGGGRALAGNGESAGAGADGNRGCIGRVPAPGAVLRMRNVADACPRDEHGGCDGLHDSRLVRLAPCRIVFRRSDPGAEGFVPDRAVCAVHVLLPPNVHATHRSLLLEECSVRSRESQN
ncbi:hypothetical protein C7S13_6656 [Burkholderia cepacia]|nr:hypothetical protein [Burkholderia cepacia]